MKSHQNRAENQLLNQTFLNNRNAQKEEKKLVLSDNDNVYLVGVNEIVRCESESNYTKFFLTENRVLLIAKTLKEYEETLDNPHFFRAHRSHLINLKYFSRLEKKDGGTIHMKDGSTLPVAVRRKDLLLEALKCL
jgi:two-component system LytT family response regulator